MRSFGGASAAAALLVFMAFGAGSAAAAEDPEAPPFVVDRKVEAGEVSREEQAAEEAAPAAQGAQVIDLAELLSRSIKAAGKPGMAKASNESEKAAEAIAQPEKKASSGTKKSKRASG